MKKTIVYIISLIIVFNLSSCFVPPCAQDNAFHFDRRGRPLKQHQKKDPPAILMKRCPKDNCHTRKIHCHGNAKYRGSPWWKKQNPDLGEGVKDDRKG